MLAILLISYYFRGRLLQSLIVWLRALVSLALLFIATLFGLEESALP